MDKAKDFRELFDRPHRHVAATACRCAHVQVPRHSLTCSPRSQPIMTCRSLPRRQPSASV